MMAEKNETQTAEEAARKLAEENAKIVFVKMQVARVTSASHACKPGDCFKMPYGEARTYVKRDQARLIDEKAYQAFVAQKAKEAQEKG